MTKIIQYKKYLVLLAAVLILFSPLATSFAHAQATATATSAPATPTQTPNFYSCVSNTGNLATCTVYFVAIAVNAFIGFFVSLGAVLVRIGLQFNDNIANSPAVQIGFSVVLSLANLGFVLGIIVIALATIIRNQTYGIKQLLWKLVVMAILVNFGLVIASPIIGFANSMSQYFVNSIAGNTTTLAGTTDGYEAFVIQMTNAFQPQAVTLPQITSTGGTGNAITVAACMFGVSNSPTAQTICQSLFGTAPTPSAPDTFMQTLVAVVFGITYGAVVAFTFLVLAVLLLVRYLFISGLLIVLPLAWLTWIFPKFSGNFHTWWNNFIKWALFPPLALFFIYLSFQTATSTVSGTAYELQATQIPAQGATGPDAAVMKESNLPYLPLQQAINEVLLVGLTMMGLMFASSLTGKAGTMVVDAGKSGTKMMAGYVGRKGKRWVGDRARTVGTKYDHNTKETTSLAQRVGSSAFMQGIPVLRRVGTTIANNTAPKAVHEERKEDVKSYIDHNLKNLTNAGLKARATSATKFVNPTVAAAVAQELARRDMTSDEDIAPLMGRYLEFAEKMGTADVVYSNRPDLMEPRMLAAKPKTATSPAVAERMETKEEAVARAVKATKGDVININAQVFNATDPATAENKLGKHVSPAMLEQAVLALNSSQMGTLGSDAGSAERKQYITEAIKNMVAPFKKEIMKKEAALDSTGVPEKDPVTGKPTGRMVDVGTGKYEIDQAKLKAAATVKKELANLESLVKHMENSSNWVSALN